jgi:hypothetical protein
MAQLALAFVGQAVGNALLPGIGGQIGFALGSALGGALSAPNLQGPRVDEPSIQLASYGSPLPATWGSDRVNGAVFWQAKPVKTTRKSGGKGKPKVVQDLYSVSFALAINERRVKSVRRIWADTKLMYDAREGASAEAQVESSKWRQYWVLYTGAETQVPDPTMEAEDGVGNVPAYRGTAYLMFTALPLEDFGNRVPNFSVEIETERDEAPIEPADGTVREPLRVYPWTLTSDGRPVHSYGSTEYTSISFGSTTETDFDAVAQAQALAIATNGAFSGVYGEGTQYSFTFLGPGYWYSSANEVLSVFPSGAHLGDDPQYITAVTGLRTPEEGPNFFFGGFFLNQPKQTHVYTIDMASGLFNYLMYRDTGVVPDSPPQHPGVGYSLVPYAQDGTDAPTVKTAWVSYCYEVQAERVPTHPPKTCRPGNPCLAPERAGEVPDDPDWCITCAGDVIPNRDWVIVGGTAKQLCGVEYRGGKLYQNALGPVLLPADPDYSNDAFWAAEAAAAVSAGLMVGDATSPVVVGSYAESTGGPTEAWEVPDADSTTLTLASVVTSICTSTGKLTAGQLDVSELTDIVIGYTKVRRMAARAALEPLRVAYLFDAVESGDKIAFRLRGRSVTATIPAADLGAGDEQASTEVLKTTRGQEDELPTSLLLAYKSLALDYQTNTQLAQRRITSSEQRANVETAVVMTDDRARAVAEALLYSQWVSRNRRELSTWRKWASVEPTDVIEVDDADL